jgi:prepilin-type N-terminal cleavage/methylation domain-containing protein
MKLQAPLSDLTRGRGPVPDKAFTLPEVLIAMAVFLLMLGGILAANLFGLRMFQINETRLNITTWSRETVGKMATEVHSCNRLSVGNITNGFFEGLMNGETQQGPALTIYPSTNDNSYITYFVNSADQTFRQTMATPAATNTVILADSVTNTIAFTAQDFLGNVLTNNLNNRVIHLTLEFYQPARFLEGADYYRLETAMTRRALE